MKTYIGTKIVRLAPMTRAEYIDYRGWALPADEDGADEGYLVEYTDGGKPNDDRHDGYITWSPKAQADKDYRELRDFSVAELAQDHILQFFAWDHLPEYLKLVSRPFGLMARDIVETLPRNTERTVALRKLLEAKDAAVRAMVAKPAA